MRGPISYNLYKIDNGKESFFRLVQLFHESENDKVEESNIRDCLKHFDLPSGDDDITYWLMNSVETNF